MSEVFQPDLSISQRRILDVVRRQPQVTRADLADLTGLTPGAISRLIRDLLESGLLLERDRISGMRGQPAVPLGICGRGGVSVGISFPYGRLDVVALDYAGQQLALVKAPFEGRDPAELQDRLTTQLEAVLSEPSVQGKRLVGIGLGIPGHLRHERKRDFVMPPTLDWLDVDSLTKWLHKAFHCPVFVENIANSAAVAETYTSEGAAVNNLVAVNFGHGVGLGLMMSGRVHSGTGGVAGEIGSLYPMAQPRPSAHDLLMVMRSAGRDVPTVDDLGAFPPQGDNLMEAWLERAAHQLFPLVQMLHMITAPEKIVLTGMLPNSVTTPLAARLSEQLKLAAPQTPLYPSRISASAFGTISSAIGAAWLAIESEGLAGQSYERWGSE